MGVALVCEQCEPEKTFSHFLKKVLTIFTHCHKGPSYVCLEVDFFRNMDWFYSTFPEKDCTDFFLLEFCFKWTLLSKCIFLQSPLSEELSKVSLRPLKPQCSLSVLKADFTYSWTWKGLLRNTSKSLLPGWHRKYVESLMWVCDWHLPAYTHSPTVWRPLLNSRWQYLQLRLCILRIQ